MTDETKPLQGHVSWSPDFEAKKEPLYPSHAAAKVLSRDEVERLQARCGDLERHIGLLITENEQLHARVRELGMAKKALFQMQEAAKDLASKLELAEAERDALSARLKRAEERAEEAEYRHERFKRRDHAELAARLKRAEELLGALVDNMSVCEGSAEKPAMRGVWFRGKDSVPDVLAARAFLEEVSPKEPKPNAALSLRERLASLCHEQWSGWMRHLFSHTFHHLRRDGEAPHSEETLPLWASERWRRQLATPYEALSEEEKESDRKEADRFLALLRSPIFVPRNTVDASAPRLLP